MWFYSQSSIRYKNVFVCRLWNSPPPNNRKDIFYKTQKERRHVQEKTALSVDFRLNLSLFQARIFLAPYRIKVLCCDFEYRCKFSPFHGKFLRACLVSPKDNANKSKRNHLKRIVKKTLTIFPKSAAFIKPAKRTFNNPTLRKNGKGM